MNDERLRELADRWRDTAQMWQDAADDDEAPEAMRKRCATRAGCILVCVRDLERALEEEVDDE